MNENRPETIHFVLQSVDGNISMGDIDERTRNKYAPIIDDVPIWKLCFRYIFGESYRN